MVPKYACALFAVYVVVSQHEIVLQGLYFGRFCQAAQLFNKIGKFLHCRLRTAYILVRRCAAKRGCKAVNLYINKDCCKDYQQNDNHSCHFTALSSGFPIPAHHKIYYYNEQNDNYQHTKHSVEQSTERQQILSRHSIRDTCHTEKVEQHRLCNVCEQYQEQNYRQQYEKREGDQATAKATFIVGGACVVENLCRRTLIFASPCILATFSGLWLYFAHTHTVGYTFCVRQRQPSYQVYDWHYNLQHKESKKDGCHAQQPHVYATVCCKPAEDSAQQAVVRIAKEPSSEQHCIAPRFATVGRGCIL